MRIFTYHSPTGLSEAITMEQNNEHDTARQSCSELFLKAGIAKKTVVKTRHEKVEKLFGK